MTTYVFQRACRALPLLLELQAAGVAVASVNPLPAQTVVDCPPEDFDRAAGIVAAHDPAAIDLGEAQAKGARAVVRQTIVAYPGKASPTAAETVAAVKALCLAVAALAREE